MAGNRSCDTDDWISTPSKRIFCASGHLCCHWLVPLFSYLCVFLFFLFLFLWPSFLFSLGYPPSPPLRTNHLAVGHLINTPLVPMMALVGRDCLFFFFFKKKFINISASFFPHPVRFLSFNTIFSKLMLFLSMAVSLAIR